MIVARFKVHFQATEPVLSWTAWKQWQAGRLDVHDDHAEFESRTGDRVLVSGVTQVSQPSRSQLRRAHDISWMVNTWIAVQYATADEASIAYFNDGRLLAQSPKDAQVPGGSGWRLGGDTMHALCRG